MTTEQGFTLELDLKSVTDEGVFSGYASTFNNEDYGRDVVLPGAFAKSLSRRPASKVKMLRGHDTTDPIGIWTDLKEDAKGLRATGKIILDTSRGRETYALLKAGALDGLSIGFRTIKDRFDRAKGVRYLEEVDLAEISVVTFPMNSLATVQAVKSTDPDRARALVSAIHQLTERFKS